MQPPNIPELLERLRRRGSDDEDKIRARLEIAEKELEQAKVEGFHDKTFANEDLQTTYDQLEKYIFGHEVTVAADEGNEESEVFNEVEMMEVPAGGDASPEHEPAFPMAGVLATAADKALEDTATATEEEDSVK